MDNRTLISIIVPYFRTNEDVLACSIKSVLASSFRNFEIILINDGSGDEYNALLEKVTKWDSRIYLINRKNNEGLSAARNYGLKVANGKYCLFLDSDDMLSPNALADMYRCLIETDADLVIGQLYTTHTHDVLIEERVERKLNYEIMDNVTALERCVTGRGFGSTACGRLASRELWFSNGENPFPNGMLHEDLASMWAIILNCQKVIFLHGYYYYYFIGGETVIHTKKKSIKFCMDYYSGLSGRNEYLKKVVPDLKGAIDYSYLAHIPIIYMHIRESENPDELEQLKYEIVKKYKNVFKEGIKYSMVSIYDKTKLFIFRFCPMAWVLAYRFVRVIKRYRS